MVGYQRSSIPDSGHAQIGKKYYTQKTGIPQGSTISTMLCNLFYGNLEAKYFEFLSDPPSTPPRSLLARMTDDFLLITLDREKAQQFLKTMHDGITEYGATVNPDKTLVNFETSVNGRKVRRSIEKELEFPYCGLWVHTRTLEVRRQRDRKEVNGEHDVILLGNSIVTGLGSRLLMSQ